VSPTFEGDNRRGFVSFFFVFGVITSAFITHAGAMASRSAVLSLAEAGISPQVGAPPADVLDPSFAPSERDGLLVIDVQTDFMPGGALEVPGGTEVIPIVNALVRRFEHVVLSQDWHPPKHSSFASQHEGKSPYDETQMPYGAQTLWPDHCVQNTPGSAFHADLAIPARARICRKGFRSAIDSYSAFFENDRVTGTGLQAHFQELGVTTVYVVGVAYDFCVRFSCEDAAARCGATAVLVKDATRAVGLPGSVEAAAKGLEQAGVRIVNAAELRS
jgi:nicotinamidase/pyrazinamidase